MLTPAIREYKKQFPAATMVLVTGASNKAVFANNPHVDTVVAVDDEVIYQGGLVARLREVYRLMGVFRKIRPSKIFILHRDWRWNVLAFLSGIKDRHGFSRHLHGMFLNRVVATTDKEHETSKYFRLLGLSGPADRTCCRPDVFPNPSDMTVATGLLGSIPATPVVAMAPGGSRNTKGEWSLKRWPLPNYQELQARLVADGCHVVLIGGPQDAEFAQTLVRGMDRAHREQVHDLAGRCSIQETYCVLEKCSLMVTHDSGPMHIAAATGIPIVSIFGPTRPDETLPQGEGCFHFWGGKGMPCSPCYHFGQMPACKTGACMKAVTPDQVYGKVMELLRGGARR